VIIGGGFGGLYAARALRRAPVEVVLLDRRNYHLFQPLLYQVATAALNPSDIAEPIRRVLRRQRNCRVLMAEATAIDVGRRHIALADGTMSYDFLIVATGATHAYFGHDEYARFAPGLKSIEDALDVRRRVLLAYEAAERATDPALREAWLTFVVVGAGPTGVELAGALAEIARHALKDDFRSIDPRQARVVLVEGLPRVLNAFPPGLSAKAAAQLERLGVRVRTNTMVTAIDDTGVTFGAERLAARTVLWAAGVAASPLARSLGVPLDRAGRVKVEPDLSIPGHPEVFVIGDLAVVEQDGKPVTGLAAIAVQEGPHAARNVVRTIRGEPRAPFRYKDKGHPRDGRPRRRRRALRNGAALGVSRVVGVALRAHLSADRVSQPLPRHVRVGVDVLHIRARGAAHHGGRGAGAGGTGGGGEVRGRGGGVGRPATGAALHARGGKSPITA
jgi:NADH dehydrogenase